MHTFAPTVVMLAALMWPATASAQSLGEVAQREAARRKAEASAPKTGVPAASQAEAQAQVQPESPADESSGATSPSPRSRAARRRAGNRWRRRPSGQVVDEPGPEALEADRR